MSNPLKINILNSVIGRFNIVSTLDVSIEYMHGCQGIPERTNTTLE
jgi:hypothetical protein